MTLLQKMDNSMHRRTKVLEVYVELGKEISLGDFLREIRDRGIEVRETQREHDAEPDDNVRCYIATLKQQKQQNHIVVLDDLRTIAGVSYMEEL